MRARVSPGPMDDGGDSNFRSFGNSAKFDDVEDCQAAMADYKFNNNQGGYINYSNALDNRFHDDDNSAFPPKILDYQDADITKEPLDTVDKARFDIFNQYKNEYKLIRGVILKLFEGEGVQR